MLKNITPLILTYNEAPNIGRTLEKLRWARDIVIVDSFSQDETLKIASRFPQVRVFQRKFDSHIHQWNFALKETGIQTEWVLALDADYVLSDVFVEELKQLNPNEVQAYQAGFIYCIDGRPLRATLYPPVTVLYRREKASYIQDGHTQRISIPGKIENLNSPIFHDDRKPFRHWLTAQDRYMKLEVQKLKNLQNQKLSFFDHIRKLRIVAPFAVLLYCLFAKGLILEGWPGIYYSFQRMLAELILSLHLIEGDFKPK